MSRQRCDRCELIVGEGCDCPGDGSSPRAVDAAAAAPRARPGFAFDRILISPQGYAHVPRGCVHWVDSPEEAGWGWIPDPSAGQWAGLGEDRPARATAGNLARTARRRCPDCEHFLG